jgi:hypothetical protein
VPGGGGYGAPPPPPSSGGYDYNNPYGASVDVSSFDVSVYFHSPTTARTVIFVAVMIRFF